ncbi:MAG: CxxC-x17-CxxC domain-containing protein [Ardenticatenaceae bacterium]
MGDRTLSCRDCSNSFIFTAGEQEFFNMKGFSDPSRCPDCRQARKRQRSSYGGGGGGGGGFGGGFGGRRERQMHSAICGDCGIQTEVPFEPRGDRPVYCRDCYQSRRRSY